MLTIAFVELEVFDPKHRNKTRGREICLVSEISPHCRFGRLGLKMKPFSSEFNFIVLNLLVMTVIMIIMVMIIAMTRMIIIKR